VDTMYTLWLKFDHSRHVLRSMPCVVRWRLDHINLAVLDVAQSRIVEAREAYEEALKIYERFAQKNPTRFQEHVERMKSLLNILDNPK
jgi:hypothetical protein